MSPINKKREATPIKKREPTFKLEEIFTKISNKKIKRDPGFCPPKEAILAMSRDKLLELWIADVRYRFNIDGNLTRLSFGFSNGSVSPKEGTYM